MPQTILPRDDVNQPLTFEGQTVVLLDNESGNYREWLVVIARIRYTIVNEGDTWTLMYFVPDINAWCDARGDVDAFLTTHKLILAA